MKSPGGKTFSHAQWMLRAAEPSTHAITIWPWAGEQHTMGQKSHGWYPQTCAEQNPSRTKPFQKNGLEQSSPGPFRTATKLTTKSNREISQQISARWANKRRNSGSKEQGVSVMKRGFGTKGSLKPPLAIRHRRGRSRRLSGCASHTHMDCSINICPGMIGGGKFLIERSA